MAGHYVTFERAEEAKGLAELCERAKRGQKHNDVPLIMVVTHPLADGRHPPCDALLPQDQHGTAKERG
jgi:hypothetical protein